MQFKAIVDDLPIHGQITRSGERMEQIEARIDDRTYTLELVEVEPRVYWLKWNDRSLDITVTPGPAGTVVSVGGRRIPVELEGAGPQRSRTSAKNAAARHDGVAELRAPMPGKIVRTLVAAGDTVRADQGVVVMEAMKMQNEIKTPKAGVVVAMSVTEGAVVNAGDLLATVE